MEKEKQINDIVEILEELLNEGAVPKNVKDKITVTVNALRDKTEVSIRINKALNELEEVADDPNLQTYTRTQIWNIVSLLEKIN